MLLTVAIVVPGTARPAQAAPDPATIAAVIGYAEKAYGYLKLLQGGGISLQEALNAIIGEVSRTRLQILAHTDSLASAPARACARQHVIEFEDIEGFNEDVLERWTQEVTGCVTLIDSLYSSVGQFNWTEKHLLGLSLGAVAPVALAAREKAGFSTAGLKDVLRQTFTAIKGDFDPVCFATPDVPEWYWDTVPNPTWVMAWFTCQAGGGGPLIGAVASKYDAGLFNYGAPYSAFDYSSQMKECVKFTAHPLAVDALAKL